MNDRRKALLRATLALIGTIIGAGVFALPAMFARFGFWPSSFLFWTLALLVLVTHLLYVDVILASRDPHRLAGHAEKWLGPGGKLIAGIIYPLQIIGTDFAYLILGGEFLAVLAKLAGIGGATLLWQIAFWAIGAASVYVGLKFVAKAESVTTWLLIASLLVVSMMAANVASPAATVGGQFEAGALFASFGVFLFSLTGVSVLGEVVEMVGRDRKRAFLATAVGSIAAAFLSWLFGSMFALAGGGVDGTTVEPLIRVLPPSWAWLLSVVGFLAIITSYLTTAQDLKASFHLDFGLPKPAAWACAMLPPLVLLFVVSRDFLSVVGLVGSVLGGGIGMMIAFMAMRVLAKKRAAFGWRVLLPALVALSYLIGLVFKLTA